MAVYTRAQLKSRMNASIKGKQGILVDVNATLDQAVRVVLGEMNLRSMKRRTTIAPGLFDDITQYPLPADMKGNEIVSLYDQEETNYAGLDLVPFDEWIQVQKLNTVAFDENSMVRILRVQMNPTGNSQIISSLDTVSAGGGAWVSYGDAVNVATDSGNYLRGDGSVKFDISDVGGLTAGIQNAGLDTFDYEAFMTSTGALFVFAYITNIDDITNIEMRMGDDASNYNQVQITQSHNNVAFQTGWNLLRFDLNNPTVVGTVDKTAGAYVALFMNKGAGKISEANFRFDQIILKTGDVHNFVYYSKYGWQDETTGAWKESSTDDGDFLNVDTDEFNLIVDKSIELAADEVDETKAGDKARGRYLMGRLEYEKRNPNDAMLMISTYYDDYV